MAFRKTQPQAVEMVSQSAISSSSSSRVLARPVVIPQVSNIYLKSFSPFSRAYAPALADLPDPISQPEFLAFVDGLNGVFVSNTFSQLGWLITIVPIVVPVLIVQIIGGLFHVLSSISSFVTTFIRTKLYISRANRELFGPRGLRCEILSTKKMIKAVGALDVSENGGKLKLPIPSELEELEYYDGSTEMAAAAEDPQARRARAVQGYVMPLSWDVSRDPMIGGFMRAHMRALNNRSLNGAVKRRAKGLQAGTEKTKSLADELAAVNREIEAMENRERRRGGPDRSSAAKLEKRSQIIEEIKLAFSTELAKADTKEESVANKVLWVVIKRVE
ncbi:hypothetical protein MPH_08167 [Macrophomina phaseolina MS6]|uniref:Uncharacterized protein n=1 Tax=Macrophomina phaseolina (strain MS6) TaxID=1126212 RepID=K2RWX0_MACPH|nr:hypothetical protein MPH_08167 [Macrophomina phaseolina MS6]